MIKKNKSIIISGILLILLSVGFTAIINFESFYEHNTSELIMYFVRALVRIGISCGAFALAYKCGRNFVLKYGWVFIPIGILCSAFIDAQGCIDVFNYSLEIVTLTNTLAILGFAIYFYKYCRKSIVHTIIFWVSSFLFLIVLESNYLTLILFVMIGMMLISARKNNLIRKKATWILNLVFYAILFLRTLNITLIGITKLSNLFYDSSYMSFIARVTFMKIKWFGAAVEPWLIGGDAAYYKLLWIFGLFGIVAGVVVFIALTAFIFFVCKKCFKLTLTDTTPIALVTGTILVVKYIISILTNFGIVLYGIFAPIPILSDGICGYIAIFIMIGLLLGKEKVSICNKLKGEPDNEIK